MIISKKDRCDSQYFELYKVGLLGAIHILASLNSDVTWGRVAESAQLAADAAYLQLKKGNGGDEW